MVARVGRLVDALGRVAAWAFVLVGGMITYEVVMRYLFNAPTIWAEELSRFVQLWATYLAAAYVLRHRRLIAITVVVNRLPAAARRAADLATLALIALFCLCAIVYGAEIALDSYLVGRADSTILALPLWLSEIAIPLCFALLLAQCALTALEVARGGALGRSTDTDAHG